MVRRARCRGVPLHIARGDQSDGEEEPARADATQAALPLFALDTAEDPHEAARWVVAGHKQLEQFNSDARVAIAKKSFIETEDASVESGLETEGDRQANLMREQIDLMRAEAGLEPAGVVPIPDFNPDYEPEPSRDEVEDPPITVGEFRRSVLDPSESADGGPSVASGFTDNEGEPLSADEAVRVMSDPSGEKAASRERAAAESVMGLPKSFS